MQRGNRYVGTAGELCHCRTGVRRIFIYPKGACDDGYYLSSCAKPFPLTEAFSYDYFEQLFRETNRKLTAKAFLAAMAAGNGRDTEKMMLGDKGGTIYFCEHCQKR